MTEATVADYIKHHIALLVIVALLIFGGVYGVESLIASHDVANAVKYEQILQEQQKQTAVLQAQLETRETEWQAQNQAALATIQKLSSGITQRTQQLDQTKQQNATLTTSQLSDKLTHQTGANPGEITATADTINIDLPTAIHIADRFDEYQTLTLNYADVQTQLSQEKTIAANLQQDVTDTKGVVTAKDVELADQKKSYEAQISQVKADARKSKARWFGLGVIVGFIGRTIL